MTDSERNIVVLVHEVRSPVAALAAVAEALREADASARPELVRLSLDACAAIERLVTDITVASVRSSVVDVGAVVRDAVLARSLAGAEMQLDVGTSLPSVRGDPVRLRQALDNLLTNAIVHAAGTDAVAVTARSTSTAVVVSVTDRGPGVPPEEVDRIFDPGVRLDATRRGTGLGLGIARAIVDAHGGRLTVESPPGSGATFTITLPRHDARHPDT